MSQETNSGQQRQQRQQILHDRNPQTPVSNDELDMPNVYRSSAVGSDKVSLLPMPSQPPPEAEQYHHQHPPGTETVWWDEAPGFSSLEQLLSPGFALPEDGSPTLFMGYDTFVTAPTGNYESMLVVPSEPSMDIIYSSL